jgi:hypothetical protein
MGGLRLRSLDLRGDASAFTAPTAIRTTGATPALAMPVVLAMLSGSSR